MKNTSSSSNKTFIVYKIDCEGIIYYGYTGNIKKRETQHRRLLKSGYKKEFYDALRVAGLSEIKLEPIRTFQNKTEAKRYEAYLILHAYFNQFQLWQSIPKIRDI